MVGLEKNTRTLPDKKMLSTPFILIFVLESYVMYDMIWYDMIWYDMIYDILFYYYTMMQYHTI